MKKRDPKGRVFHFVYYFVNYRFTALATCIKSR